MKKALLILVVAMTFSAGAQAQDQSRIDRIQLQQQMRIRQGWSQGDLTRREMLRLRASQHRIRRVECFAKADGRISARERVNMRRVQVRASQQIYRQRHDRVNRLN